MKKNIIKNLVLITILSIFTFNNISFAEEKTGFENPEEEAMKDIINNFKPDAEEAKAGETEISCDSNAYLNYINDETTDFLNFLEQHFSSANSTSTLTNIAISRFREYKNRLETFSVLFSMNVQLTKTANKNLQELSYIYPRCREIVDMQISTAKDKMINKISQNAYQKRSFALIEKYKTINGKLSELALKISDMINLYKSFKNKLPSFTTPCFKAIF